MLNDDGEPGRVLAVLNIPVHKKAKGCGVVTLGSAGLGSRGAGSARGGGVVRLGAADGSEQVLSARALISIG